MYLEIIINAVSKKEIIINERKNESRKDEK